MKNKLNGKTVILTGISSGIGKEIAKLLIEKYDCKVYGIARNENKILKFKSELENKENFIGYSLFDVSLEEKWLEFSKFYTERFKSADVLINCAGMLPKFSKFEKTDVKTIDTVMKVNFYSCVYSSKYMMPILEKSTFPSIVNVSSSASLVTFAGISGYSASKSALKSFSLCLSEEYGRNTYVGCICPGFTDTDIFINKTTTSKELNLIKKLCTSPQKVAKKTVKAIEKRKRLKIIGYDAKLMNFFYKIFPNFTSKLITKILKKSGFELFKNI